MSFKSVTLLTTCVRGSVALLSVGTCKRAAGDMSASFAALWQAQLPPLKHQQPELSFRCLSLNLRARPRLGLATLKYAKL